MFVKAENETRGTEKVFSVHYMYMTGQAIQEGECGTIKRGNNNATQGKKLHPEKFF